MRASVPGAVDRQKMKKTKPKEMKLGRYPFEAAIPYYLAKKYTKYSSSTYKENERKLHYFAEIFQELKDKKLASTTDPRHIDQYDIEAFLDYMREANLVMSTKIKYTNILESFLVTFDNDTISKMKNTDDWPLMKSVEGDARALEIEELQRIFDAIDNYEPKDEIDEWHNIIISGVIALLFGTACRPKEVFNAKVKDLELKKNGENAFFIEHPKGEGTWGKQEWIPIIRGDMAERLSDFMIKRNQYMKAHNLTSVYLFPNLENGQPYNGNTIRRIKREIEELSGVEFKLKDMRSSYVTITAGQDMDRLNNVSVQLRHKSVKTTEGYYLRLNRPKAQKKIAGVWEETAIRKSKQ